MKVASDQLRIFAGIIFLMLFLLLFCFLIIRQNSTNYRLRQTPYMRAHVRCVECYAHWQDIGDMTRMSHRLYTSRKHGE